MEDVSEKTAQNVPKAATKRQMWKRYKEHYRIRSNVFKVTEERVNAVTEETMAEDFSELMKDVNL